MSEFRDEIQTYVRQAEAELARLNGVLVEKAADHVHDVNLPGVEPVSTIDLPSGVEELDPQYPGVRKVGVGRRVFHMVPPEGQEQEWHLTNSQDDILFSAASDEGLAEALGDIVSLSKPGPESKSALVGRSRPLTTEEAVEYLMFTKALEGDGTLEEKAAGLGYVDTDPDPSPKKGARTLRRYWTRGPGAAKIRWGTSGDFKRCVRQLRKYVGTGAEGLCNVYHTSALGAPPGKGH